ncbi:S-locus glycoprotein domain-containing protein [Artemisia annua]|uniref:S-locus glycoprotein domain-containing protein n=1 Tax=Artemisia annua TaxID=35608 RepID=A0A2U1LLJ3_ARTAN|nr:S-locus glycoprotein domain-containing protein [Artemisia annua]
MAVSWKGSHRQNCGCSHGDRLVPFSMRVHNYHLGQAAMPGLWLQPCRRKGDMEVPLISLSEVSKATNNFSVDNKLGEGGFDPVSEEFQDGEDVGTGCEVQTSDDRHVFCCPICTTQHCNLMLLPHKCPSASHGRPNIVPDSIDAAKLIKLLLRMLESRNQTAT